MPQPPHSTQRGPSRCCGEPHVELGRRLGEREVVRAPAGARLGAEHRPREVVQRALQVGHRDALVHDEPLDLVEHRRVGGVELVGPVDPPRHHHVDRRRARTAWCAPAPARCACAAPGPDDPLPVAGRGDPERVHQAAGRVVGRDVERVEVGPLQLDLGALGDLVPHADEQVADALHQRGQRVPGPARAAVPAGSVTSTRSSTSTRRARSASSSARRLSNVDWIAARAALTRAPASALACGRQRADLPAGQRDRRPVAQVQVLHRGQRVDVGRRRRTPSAACATASSSARLARAARPVSGRTDRCDRSCQSSGGNPQSLRARGFAAARRCGVIGVVSPPARTRRAE